MIAGNHDPRPSIRPHSVEHFSYRSLSNSLGIKNIPSDQHGINGVIVCEASDGFNRLNPRRCQRSGFLRWKLTVLATYLPVCSMKKTRHLNPL